MTIAGSILPKLAIINRTNNVSVSHALEDNAAAILHSGIDRVIVDYKTDGGMLVMFRDTKHRLKASNNPEELVAQRENAFFQVVGATARRHGHFFEMEHNISPMRSAIEKRRAEIQPAV